MAISNNEKTSKDRQLSITEGIKPYLLISSPFSVWEPIEKMDYRVGRVTRCLTANDVESRHIQGRYPKSDMHILRAVHSFGYCTLQAASRLLEYWKRKDEEQAKLINRPALCIPDSDTSSLWNRLTSLCHEGVLVCHQFFANETYRDNYEADKGRYRNIFNVNGIGAGMYKTTLQDKSITYDNRQQYLNEEEVFRRVMNGNMTASFLRNPFLLGVRFSVVQQVGNKKIPLLSVLKMSANGKEDNDSKVCKLILESVTVKTNPIVITRDARILWIQNRMKELKIVLDEYRKEQPTYIILCAEDANGINIIKECIKSIDINMLRYCLFTTGTILEQKDVLGHPEKLYECFMEFKEDNNGFNIVGATGYYFLD